MKKRKRGFSRRVLLALLLFLVGLAALFIRFSSFAKIGYDNFSFPKRRACTSEELSKVPSLLSSKRRGELSRSIRALLSSIPEGQECGGFFVECGANNGLNSLSLSLERDLGWRGICIEANPSNFLLLQKNRPLCENRKRGLFPEKVNLTFRSYEGHLHGHSGFLNSRAKKEWKRLEKAHPQSAKTRKEFVVEGVPPEEIIKRKCVDLFGLDVEGAEMEILKQFPFEKVKVKYWIIETNQLSRRKLIRFMEKRRYSCKHIDKINTLCEWQEKISFQ